jgi:septal ring factor EnvC (AmiA/AmiB activator)
MSRSILALALLLFLAVPAMARVKSVAEELERIKTAISSERKKLEAREREQNKILAEIELIDKKVKFYSQTVAELKKQQALIKKQIQALENEIRKIKDRLESQKKLLAQRLRARYEMGEIGTMEVLFSSEQISELVLRDEYLGRVYEQDARLIREYEAGLAELDRRKSELAEKQIELEASLEAATWSLQQLDSEKDSKKTLLEKLRREKDSHLAALSELEEAAQNLEAQLKEIERQSRPELFRPGAAPPVELKKSCLPVDGRIDEKFGPRIDPHFGTKTMHKGVDITAPAGKPVRAIAAGQVVFADWFRGYGNLIIVDHNNGYYSLYAHLDRIDKRAGDQLKKGTQLGTVGETGSLKGPFLYFELRYHTEAINPELFLDPSCVLAGPAK